MAQTDSVLYMDRRLTGGSAGVSSSFSAGSTTFTLPYSVDVGNITEGALVIARTDTPAVLTSTRPAANQIRVTGDFTAIPVVIGVVYPFTATLSRIFVRDSKGRPDISARLNLEDVQVKASESTEVTVLVSRAGRGSEQKTGTQTNPGAITVQMPVRVPNTDARISVRSSNPGACALTGIVWRGAYYPRSARRV